MKNFYDWVESKDINENFSTAQTLMNQPMTAGVKRGLGIMDKATSKMHDTNIGSRRIMGGILQQVKSLDVKSQQKLARMIMSISRNNGLENQAINPKARFEDDGGI